jgi:hypothetical protein
MVGFAYLASKGRTVFAWTKGLAGCPNDLCHRPAALCPIFKYDGF